MMRQTRVWRTMAVGEEDDNKADDSEAEREPATGETAEASYEVAPADCACKNTSI